MEQGRIIGELYMVQGLESMMDIAVFNCSSATDWMDNWTELWKKGKLNDK